MQLTKPTVTIGIDARPRRGLLRHRLRRNNSARAAVAVAVGAFGIGGLRLIVLVLVAVGAIGIGGHRFLGLIILVPVANWCTLAYCFLPYDTRVQRRRLKLSIRKCVHWWRSRNGGASANAGLQHLYQLFRRFCNPIRVRLRTPATIPA